MGKQVKKLSVKTVYGLIDIKRVLNADEPIPVMYVGGTCVGYKLVPSPYGEATALQGNFIARHPDTGEEFNSSTLFLPDVAMIPIQVALAAGARGVDFAILVQVQAATGGKPGGVPYEYTFVDRMPQTENDPLARVRLLLAPDTNDPAQLTGPAGAANTPAAKTPVKKRA